MKKIYYLIAVLVLAFQLNAQCVTPTALTATNVSTNGAYLFADSTTTTGTLYNIRYHASFNATWTVREHITLPYQLGSLGCNTTYVWQVQQICVSPAGVTSVSDWSALATFTTAQCTAPPPAPCLTPTGLLSSNISQTTASLHLNTTTANALLYNIRYRTGASTSWTTVEHVALPYQLGSLTCGTSYEWQAQLVCINSVGTNSSEWSASATFTTLTCNPTPCNSPTGLSATNVSQTGAYLYLMPTSSNAGTFNIRYHSGTSTAWTTLEHVSLPYQLGNLSCSTTYEWQAQLICTNPLTGAPLTTVSPWSTAGTFTTSACSVPTPCNAPTGLTATNVSQTGVSLNLTPTSTIAGLFNIRYHSGTATTWTYAEHVTLPYQLGNLTCGTTYEWQVQLICTNSITVPPETPVSPWSAAATFTTLACPVPTPCNAPTGLTATNVSQTGVSLNLTPTSTIAGLFNIRYHAGTTTTWTYVEHVALPYQLGNLTCGTTYEWQAQLICTNSAAGAITVSPWSTAGTFTTLACPVPTPCNAPTGLSATNVSQNGAYLYLSPTSGNTGLFNIRYHAGTTLTWTMVEHVSLPYQLGNLTCGTTYQWQVQRICHNSATGAVSVSPWSATVTFTTLSCPVPTPCNPPIGLIATNISQNGASLHLSPTLSNTGVFNIRYHNSATATWTMVEHVSLPFQLGNLACGTTYEWQVQLICANSATGTTTTVSPWSTGGMFTTLACPVPTSCNTPTGLSATNVTQTGASLYLTPTSGNAGIFNIRYHNGTTTTWTVVEHVTLPYQLGSLTCGTTYEWQAQLICPNGTVASTAVTPWSTAGTFTTLPCTTAACPAPTGLIATNINSTSAILHWNTVPGALAYIVRYKKANNTALEFTSVTVTTNVLTLNSLTAGSYYIWQVQAVCSTTVAGLSGFSPIVTFATPAVTIFPNPANGFVNVSFWLNKPSNATIVLRDSQGQIVYSQVILAQLGANTIEINTSSLSVGLYFLSVQTNAYSITKKVVIGH